MSKIPIMEFIKQNRPYFENLITRSTYNSNRIEGNTLSFADTYAILFNDNSFKITAAPREIYEAINHKYALNYLFRHLEEPLTVSFLQDLCGWINHNIIEIDATSLSCRSVKYLPRSSAGITIGGRLLRSIS